MDKEQTHSGRPRSEHARTAILNAADDLLVEIGYAAMTMKSISERAGVSRQTVYRWWSHKAEILLEASIADAEEELAINPTGDPLDDLTAYVEALVHFLAHSPAGAAYRALLGEAQHDNAVAELLSAKDPLGDSARIIIEPVLENEILLVPLDLTTALLVGPIFFWILSGRNPAELVARKLSEDFIYTLKARYLR